MEEDDNMIVVIISDGQEEGEVGGTDSSHLVKQERVEMKEEYLSDEIQIEDLIKTVEEHGSVIKSDADFAAITEDIADQFFKTEYLEDLPEESDDLTEYVEKLDDESYTPDFDECNDDSKSSNDEDISYQYASKTRLGRYRKDHVAVSFVDELRNAYPELADDDEMMVETLTGIMKAIKPPDLPENFCSKVGYKFKCSVCNGYALSLVTAQRHFREKHGPRYLKCFACGVDFRSRTNLYKHEKKCVYADSILVLKARANFVGARGRDRPFVEEYKHRLKSDESQKRFTCPQCPASYKYKQSLVGHLYMHNGERPFQCAECPNAYTSKTALYKHESSHLGLMFVCDICGRSCKSKSILQTHMNTHLPVKKYGCDLCERRYATKAAVERHIHTRHLNLPKPFPCQLCEQRYLRMSQLKEHMKKSHKMLLITRKSLTKILPKLADWQLQRALVVMKSDMRK